MDDLIFGLEILFVGFSVVVATLFLLAYILKVFSKLLSYERKSEEELKTKKFRETAKGATHTKRAESGLLQRVIVAKDTEEREPVSLEPESGIALETVAAAVGALICFSEQPEIYEHKTAGVISEIPREIQIALGIPQNDQDYYLARATAGKSSKWAEAGKNRLLQLRQDFLLIRRRMRK